MTRSWIESLSRCNRWTREMARPVPAPTWTTPNAEVLTLPLATLRRFDSERQAGAPWLVVTPNAGHHSVIGDYAPGQSLVEVLLAHGDGAPVFGVEWHGADESNRHAGIDDYLLALDRMVNHARRAAGTRRVRLVGLCQGGWLSAMLAALIPDVVENLVLAASPIDFRAGRGKLTRAVEGLGAGWYELLVRQSGGVMLGSHMLAGWKMLNPVDRFFRDPLDLWRGLDDERYMERHRRFRAWYEWTQNLPGPFYLQVVRELFDENRLVKGTFRALGRLVDLGRIHCPVSTIGGLTDDITLQEQLEAIEDHVSSPVVRKRMVPAGHVGVFMKKSVVQGTWPDLIREALADAETVTSRVKTFSVLGAATLTEQGASVASAAKGGKGLLLACGEREPRGIAEHFVKRAASGGTRDEEPAPDQVASA